LRREDATWDPEIVNDSLQVIEEEADRLTRLIENLLDASRLQAGGLSLMHSDVYLPDVAKRSADRFSTQTTTHKITVSFPEGYPIIFADESRLEQVFYNLISNAIKYSPQGEITISGRIRGEEVVVCISDEGKGIHPDDLPHVFDRFYRGPDTERNTQGAGLGLFLTRAIIEAHQGRIWVDTSYADGARICFSLPIMQEV
jgi:signal transduction histidine kinase